LNLYISCFFFFQAEDGIRDLTVTGVQTCALPISVLFLSVARYPHIPMPQGQGLYGSAGRLGPAEGSTMDDRKEKRNLKTFLAMLDRKSTRLNSSHSQISYAVFCLKKKK